MSILRPKDGDYIVRGIFLLVCWVCIGGVPLAVLGGIIAGVGGATVAFIGALFIAPIIFWFYLRLDPKVYPQKTTDANDWSV